jgi:hypothetical protein
VRRRRSHAARRPPFIACSRCSGSGLLILEVVRDGRREREAKRCDCLREWLQLQKAPAQTPLERERKDLA